MLEFARSAGRPVATILILLLAALPAAAAVKREPPGADSPQAVVARLEKASQTNDFAEVAACVTPEDRKELAMGLLVGTTMMVAFSQMGGEMAGSMAEGMTEGMTGQEMSAKDKAELEKQKKKAAEEAKKVETKFRAVLEKNGLSEFFSEDPAAESKPGDQEKAMAALDKADQVALIGDLMGLLESLGENQAKEKKPVELPGKVTDYKIQGDKATAKAGDETVEFLKIGGRWYLKAPEKKEKGPGA